MGGSSSGGGGNYSTGMSKQEKQAIADQRASLGQQTGALNTSGGFYGQIGALGNSADVNALAGSGLTQAEQMQLGLVDMGRQGMEQAVRDQASARGLYSSAGAIASEGIIPMTLAGQKADIYGNAQQRQFQGLGLKSGLLGTAAGGYGSVAGGYGSVAGGYGNIVGQYQNSQQISNQAQQAQDQFNLNQQQQQRQNIIGAGRLIAAPFTGGASLIGGF